MTHISKVDLIRNAMVRECLTDMADRDYLAARICWRTRLPEQFLWNALQAIEKQLKAILVLNNRSARGLSHDIERALDKVCAIPDLRLDPPTVIRDFVGYLNRHGPNRYAERSITLRGAELFELDRAFWHFRRYCQDFRATARYLKKSEDEWLAMHHHWYTDPKHTERPHRFRMFGGYLEDVLDGKKCPEQYRALVWKNVFYGRRYKPRIEYRPLTQIGDPAHIRHPEVFSELLKILDFPRDVRAALAK